MTNASNSSDSNSITLTSTDLFNLKRSLKLALEEYREIDGALKDKLIDYLAEGKDPGCMLEIGAAVSNPSKSIFKLRQNALTASGGSGNSKLVHPFVVTRAPHGYFARLGEWLLLHPLVKAAVASSELVTKSDLPPWFHAVVLAYLALGHSSGARFGVIELRVTALAETLTDAELEKLITVMVHYAGHQDSTIGDAVFRAKDAPAFLEKHASICRIALSTASPASVENVLTRLLDSKANFSALLPAIVAAMLGSSKFARRLGAQIIPQHREPMRELLVEKLKTGTASERIGAAELLAENYGVAVLAELKEVLSVEKGSRLKQTIEGLVNRIESESTVSDDATEVVVQLPPIEFPAGPIPLPEGFREAFEKHLASEHAKAQEYFEKQTSLYNAGELPKWMSKPDAPALVEPKTIDNFCRYLEGEKASFEPQNRDFRARIVDPIENWFDTTHMHILHIARWMRVSGEIHFHGGEPGVRPHKFMAHRAKQSSPYGLREMDAAVEQVSGYVNAISNSYLGYDRYLFELEDEAVWPLFFEKVDALKAPIMGISLSRYSYNNFERKRNAIAIAGLFPVMPLAIENALWTIALGEAKTDRTPARRALSKVRGRLQRGLQAIEDGKQGIRIAGAELLADLGDSAAIEPLKKALKSEKQEAVKGSFLQAIEILGGDVEEFLGRRKQLLDAKKALEAKLPKGMEWFPLDTLPEVRWKEDDKPVAPEIVRAWIVQSIRFKLPTCGALLRRAMQMCRTDDTVALAKFVLNAWVSYDTQPPNPAESLAKATAQASAQYKANKWLKEMYETEEEYRDSIYREMQGRFLNSAINEKGVLAVVSAGGDKQCVRIIEKYIRTHHGQRLAQSKALLETLGWIEDPLAVQVLLSIGNRFRTASIRKRAAELVQELADRKGWTKEQLADRTIPDAGFIQPKDEEGKPTGKRATLVLDYGARKFNVIMNDDLEPVISREDGKEVKSLPAPAKDDDPELVKAAKAEFTAAKKTVKDVVKLLAEQLYEAVCNQRTWGVVEWKTFLASHPIAGALCRRVVWRTFPKDQPELAICFRPLEDGTFTDVDDNGIELVDSNVISVAHSSLISAEQREGWINHLKDYEVPKLFDQFGRGAFDFSLIDKEKTDIDTYQGHMLTTFLLRNKATKLGWQRGPAEDGGSFSHYFKVFWSSRVSAILEFTGSYLPEPDLPAGLRTLYFVTVKENEAEAAYRMPAKLKLKNVPAILVSECYNDVRDIAAEGSGFDPDWEKKGLW